MRVHAQFLLSASDVRHFPAPTLPEIAFLGRSNVGKSSLINALVGSKIAKTSSTPGRTQTINFFSIRREGRPQPEMLFTDLPGYGYARVPRGIAGEWNKFIEPYLLKRPTLALCVALLDANVPPQGRDRDLLEFLGAAGRQVLLVATKCDRLSGNQLRNALAELSSAYPEAQLLQFSAKTGHGKAELWRALRSAAANLDSFPSVPPSF